MPEQVALQGAQGGEHLRAVPNRVELIAQRFQLQVQLLPAAAVLPGLQQLRRLGGAGILLRRGLAGIVVAHPADHLAADEQKGHQRQHHHNGIGYKDAPLHYNHPR